jgi:quercetin dioxygenase-like cupin family protein
MTGTDSSLRRRTRGKLGAVVAAVALTSTAAVSTVWAVTSASPATKPATSVHDHHEQDEDDIVFGPAPPAFPAGAEMAVLQGDPSKPGEIFTVRLRLPKGYILPPHRHPTDENVTVISGAFQVGIGDVFDAHALLPTLHEGGFITAPANVSHFAQTKGRTVVQVHAIGPFEMTYVNPADDPRTHQ